MGLFGAGRLETSSKGNDWVSPAPRLMARVRGVSRWFLSRDRLAAHKHPSLFLRVKLQTRSRPRIEWCRALMFVCCPTKQPLHPGSWAGEEETAQRPAPAWGQGTLESPHHALSSSPPPPPHSLPRFMVISETSYGGILCLYSSFMTYICFHFRIQFSGCGDSGALTDRVPRTESHFHLWLQRWNGHQWSLSILVPAEIWPCPSGQWFMIQAINSSGPLLGSQDLSSGTKLPWPSWGPGPRTRMSTTAGYSILVLDTVRDQDGKPGHKPLLD